MDIRAITSVPIPTDLLLGFDDATVQALTASGYTTAFDIHAAGANGRKEVVGVGPAKWRTVKMWAEDVCRHALIDHLTTLSPEDRLKGLRQADATFRQAQDVPLPAPESDYLTLNWVLSTISDTGAGLGHSQSLAAGLGIYVSYRINADLLVAGDVSPVESEVLKSALAAAVEADESRKAKPARLTRRSVKRMGLGGAMTCLAVLAVAKMLPSETEGVARRSDKDQKAQPASGSVAARMTPSAAPVQSEQNREPSWVPVRTLSDAEARRQAQLEEKQGVDLRDTATTSRTSASGAAEYPRPGAHQPEGAPASAAADSNPATADPEVQAKLLKELRPYVAKCKQLMGPVKATTLRMKKALDGGDMDAFQRLNNQFNAQLDRIVWKAAAAHDGGVEVLEAYREKGIDVETAQEQLSAACSVDDE